MTHSPSPEQQLVLDAVTNTSNNLLISACAGGAKTTTMCMAAQTIGPGRQIVALAFNSDAATSLKFLMPYFVQSSTFHSYCYGELGTYLGRKPKPDGNRCKWFLKELIPNWKERTEVEDVVLKLVSGAKSQTESNLNLVAKRFDLDPGTRELELAQRILDKCLEQPFKSIDFDDMLWLPYKLGIEFKQKPAVVFLDEAQDTNGVQRTLLEKILGIHYANCAICGESPNGCEHYSDGKQPFTTSRLIAVGDEHQSIYGFRGADHNAMSLLQSDFAMTQLELSVSYRCSVAVCKEASKYL